MTSRHPRVKVAADWLRLKFVGTKSGVAPIPADTVIAMGFLSWWDLHRLRTAVGTVLRWVVPPCAVLGFLLGAGSACSGPAPHDDQPVKNFAVQAIVAFLRATTENSGQLRKYFPGVVFDSADLPPRPETIFAVVPGQPQANGTDTWIVPVSVATNSGDGEAWRLKIKESVDGDTHTFAGTQLPSPWPSETASKDRPATQPEKLKQDDALFKAAQNFLTTWMGGKTEDVGRYATSADIAPAWPKSASNAVEVVAVRVMGTAPSKVSGTVTVTADVVVSGRHNRPGTYRLQLKAINGQWMVAAVNPSD